MCCDNDLGMQDTTCCCCGAQQDYIAAARKSRLPLLYQVHPDVVLCAAGQPSLPLPASSCAGYGAQPHVYCHVPQRGAAHANKLLLVMLQDATSAYPDHTCSVSRSNLHDAVVGPTRRVFVSHTPAVVRSSVDCGEHPFSSGLTSCQRQGLSARQRPPCASLQGQPTPSMK